jgi:hypothetical protein
MSEICSIFFSDVNFTVLSDGRLSNVAQNEIRQKVFPNGSNWKMYAGARSLCFFQVSATSSQYVLGYSLITKDIDASIISFVIMSDYTSMVAILKRRIVGIQSAYLRRINRFLEIERNSTLKLVSNLLFLYANATSPVLIDSVQRWERTQIGLFENPLLWRVIEGSVIESATKKLQNVVSFRTLTLQKERNFSVVAIAKQ